MISREGVLVIRYMKLVKVVGKCRIAGNVKDEKRAERLAGKVLSRLEACQ